jgi:prepilin-type N-terminal cleavage/methylation domain-containing protein
LGSQGRLKGFFGSPPAITLKTEKKGFIILGPRDFAGEKGVQPMRRPRHIEGGFTLIEILITIFILGAVSISLISVFIYGFSLQTKTKQTALATQVAQFEVERYRNMNFADIPIQDSVVGTKTFQDLFNDNDGEGGPYNFLFKKDGGVFIPSHRNGRETIVIVRGDTIGMDEDIKRMTVTVDWDYRTRTIVGGNPMRKDVVTYFSKDGINRR